MELERRVGDAGEGDLERGDRTPQKWYNMQQIDMSGNLPMRRRAENAKVRCSAAYPTERKLDVKRTSLPWVSMVLMINESCINT